MILTGKAKGDFVKWVYSEYDYKYEHLKDFYPLHLLDGLIIEWFDSVGIYVDVNKWSLSFWRSSIYYPYLKSLGCGFSTRQEATTEAIIKANEIYNEL